MAIKKAVDVMFVKANADLKMPAHVKLDWLDKLGRRHSHLLPLTDEEVERIAKMPDDEAVK